MSELPGKWSVPLKHMCFEEVSETALVVVLIHRAYLLSGEIVAYWRDCRCGECKM